MTTALRPATVPELKTRNVVTLTAMLQSIAGEEIVEALELMAYAHDGGLRKEVRPAVEYVDPYAIHPIRVALRIMRLLDERGCEIALLQAALLHDAVEDEPARVLDFYGREPGLDPRAQALEQIERAFGPQVSGTVARVSNPDFSGMTAAERDDSYLAHLRETVAPCPMASAVKASDLIDNAGSLHHMAPGPRQGRLARKYWRPVALMTEVATDHGMPAMAVRLRQVTARLGAIMREQGIERP